MNGLRFGIVLSNQLIETAPPELGAVSGRSPGARESASPQAVTAGPDDFSLALERDGGETAVLVLAGELDLYRAPAVEEALAEANVRHLVVDLRLVTFIDATTLALLLAASRRQHAQEGQLLVFVGPQTPMTAFEVTGLDRLLAIRRLNDDPSTPQTHGKRERAGVSRPPRISLKGRNYDDISRND
jgi:anti-anti-sigma factor